MQKMWVRNRMKATGAGGTRTDSATLTMLGTTHTMLGTSPTMLGTIHTMLRTTPTMLGTTPTMLGTIHTMLGTTPGCRVTTGRLSMHPIMDLSFQSCYLCVNPKLAGTALPELIPAQGSHAPPP